MRDGKEPAGTSHPGRTPVAGDAPRIVPRIRPGPQDILEKLPDPAAAGGEEGGAGLGPPPSSTKDSVLLYLLSKKIHV